jgi:molybdate transport system ATP-binding protein
MSADPSPRPSASLEVRVVLEGAFALDVAFEASPGFTVVSGPSGSGKSTLLAAIAGFVRPVRGRIAVGPETWFDADQRVHVPPQKRHVAIVFQSLALFPHLTALENVAYGAPRSLGREARRDLALGLLGRLRVVHVATRRPSTFSGGEAQRVALARALAMRPLAVLLDEPFSALDPKLRRDLVSEVRDVLAELQVPVILVTHQPEEASEPGDRFVQLDDGRVARRGVY